MNDVIIFFRKPSIVLVSTLKVNFVFRNESAFNGHVKGKLRSDFDI